MKKLTKNQIIANKILKKIEALAKKEADWDIPERWAKVQDLLDQLPDEFKYFTTPGNVEKTVQ